MNKVRSNEAGMTLLELMFAAGVVAMALAMIFGSLISVSAMGRIAESRATAASTLASVIEELKVLPFDDVLAYTPPALEGPSEKYLITVGCVVPHPGADGLGVGEEASGSQVGGETGWLMPLPLSANYSGTLPNPLELRVRIAWQENDGRTYERTASAFIGR